MTRHSCHKIRFLISNVFAYMKIKFSKYTSYFKVVVLNGFEQEDKKDLEEDKIKIVNIILIRNPPAANES